MIISEIVTLGIYAFSMIFLPEYFGPSWSPSPYPLPELKHSHLLNSCRSIVCPLSAVRVESGGHGRGERVTAMDHQGYQESHRTRGNDEALEKQDRCKCAALLACALLPSVSFCFAAGPTDGMYL